MAEAAPEPAAAAPAAAGDHPRAPRGAAVRRAAGRPGRRHRPGDRHVGVDAGDRRVTEPARRGQGRRDRRAQGPARRRQGERRRRGPDGAGRRQRDHRPRQRQAGDRGHRADAPTSATWATRSGSPRRSPRAPATPRSWSRRTPRSPPRPRRRSRRRSASSRSAATRSNEAIVALAVRTAPSGLSHSAFVSVANLGLDAGRAPDPALRRRRPARLAGAHP